MHRSLSLALASALLWGIYGCTTEGPPETSPIAGTEIKPVEPSAGHNANEVVVRICSGVSEDGFDSVLVRHRLELQKRSSPSIATLSWQDGRTVEAVVTRLLEEKGVICFAQPNYQYKALPK